MKVLLAGASGVFGTVLVPALVAAGHEVTGITRNAKGAERIAELGGSAVVTVDALDRPGLLKAVEGMHFDAVISQLTALSKPPMRHKDMHQTNVLRVEGTENLMAVAHAVGATRFLTQSMIFGYGYGDLGETPLTESAEFGPAGRKHFDDHGEAMLRNEQIAFGADGIDGISLRYGLFYGNPATAAFVGLLKARKLPVVPGGLNSFIHLADAATATVAALEHGRGGEAYNIVDDTPVMFGELVSEAARVFQAPKPMRFPAWLLKPMQYSYTFMTGRWIVSNAKAKAELDWKPRYASYREGLRADAAANVSASPVQSSEAPSGANPAEASKP
jgi:nucleoside-diphosphate-sugar epimerase